MAIGSNEALAVTALTRFGLGARPGDLRAAANDPRGFLIEELRTANIALLSGDGLASGPAVLQAFYLEQQQKRFERATMAAMEQPAQLATPSGQANASARPVAPKPVPPKPPIQQITFREEAFARLNKQLKAPAGFVERLVAFWSNHFAVSVAKGGPVLASAGAFEREAIRPNILGRFSSLVLAVESHPAMILFLDNQRSIGPDAPAGKFAGRGLNEISAVRFWNFTRSASAGVTRKRTLRNSLVR